MGNETAARPGSTGFSTVIPVTALGLGFFSNLEYILRVGQTPPSKSIPEHFCFLKLTYFFESFIYFWLQRVVLWLR